MVVEGGGGRWGKNVGAGEKIKKSEGNKGKTA